MGFFENLFGKSKNSKVAEVAEQLKMIDGYTPSFTTFDGGLFEMDLTRAIISSFARHCSKLKPECHGSGNEKLARQLQNRPNPFQNTSQFLMQVATLYELNNTVFIMPLENQFGQIIGIYPISPLGTELVEYKGELFVRYSMYGEKHAIEFNRVGIMSQHNNKDGFFGDTNKAFETQLELMHTQNEGIIEGIQSSAKIRFMAKIANILKDKDIEAERKRFTELNLTNTNTSGLMIFDNKYSDVTQVKQEPWMVDNDQMESIKKNAFIYFGTNSSILMNDYTSDQWNAYYEGKIEPFAIQLSLVLTWIYFTEKERAHGNGIILAANRLQYLSNDEKLQTVVQLFDRGFITHNDGLEIFNMQAKDDGDKYYIRKEYMEFNKESDMNEGGGEDEDDTGQTEGEQTVQDAGDTSGNGE